MIHTNTQACTNTFIGKRVCISGRLRSKSMNVLLVLKMFPFNPIKTYKILYIYI